MTGGCGAHLLLSVYVVKDVNGCSNGRRYFDPGPFTFKRDIRYLSVLVCESDADGDATSSGICSFREFKNWRFAD